MKRLAVLFAVLAAALVASAVAAPGTGRTGDDADGGGGGGQRYSVGLWGDVPYSTEQQAVGVPNLLAEMNREQLAFSVHVGDLKQGSNSPCDDALYVRSEGYFNTLRAPAVYTPGDNEWTDCDRPSNGGYNSFERLTHIRTTMFDTGYSFGRHRLRQDVQAAPYVENRRWRVGPVTYVTLSIPGSNNNRSDTAPDPAESAARTAASIAWLQQAFDDAREQRSRGVMVIIQANPGFDRADPTRAPTRDPQTLVADLPAPDPNSGDGFDELLRQLRAEVIELNRPVVLVHGDSHYFRVDKPLLDRNGHRIEHFSRVETPGDNAQSGNNDVQWVRALIDGTDDEVFTFEQEVVAPNLQAYTP
jgi:hypothetical protein